MRGESTARFRDATVADDDALRSLLHRPMDGAIRVALTRDPSFHDAARIEGDRHHTFVVGAPLDTGGEEVLGFGCRCVRRRYLAGRPALVGYLHQLRSVPGAFTLRRIKAGYRQLEQSRRPDEAPFDFTTILADNRPARRLLERGLRGLPEYRPLAEIETLILATGRPGKSSPAASVRRPEARDGEEILRLLESALAPRPLAPMWEEQDLMLRKESSAEAPQQPEPPASRPGRGDRRALGDWRVVEEGGEILACGAVWDQRGFKQAVVTGYAPLLGTLRPVLNVGLRLAGRPTLPAPGSQLAMGYLAGLAVRGNEPELARALVRSLLADARRSGLEQLVLSLPVEDPLLPDLRRSFAHRPYRSILYAVLWPSRPQEPQALEKALGPGLPYLEAALL